MTSLFLTTSIQRETLEKEYHKQRLQMSKALEACSKEQLKRLVLQSKHDELTLRVATLCVEKALLIKTEARNLAFIVIDLRRLALLMSTEKLKEQMYALIKVLEAHIHADSHMDVDL